MQARYYDPEVGRFLSADPPKASAGDLMAFNRFAYGHNNPINTLDPDGRRVIFVSKGAERLVTDAAARSPTIATQYSQLEASSREFTVTYAHVSTRDSGQSHVTPANFTDALSEANGGTGKGTGAAIYINKKQESVRVADSKNGVPTVVPVTPDEVVSHEFSHAIDNDNGDTSNSSQEREHKAREVEDQYRQEQDLPGRRNNVEGN